MNDLETFTRLAPVDKSFKVPVPTPFFRQEIGSPGLKTVRCEICPLNCRLAEGEIGVCGGRQVIDNELIAVNYAQVCSLQLDPIEKKPLYHYYPGSDILSVGPNGCNLNCKWCQNWPISQNKAPTRTVMPDELADMVDALDGIGVAYTYAEPLIWFEYVLDAGRALHERGLVNIFISNGFVNREPFRKILDVADAFNFDLKSADDDCYRNFCGGKLEDIQRTILMSKEAGKHVEITHLVVTGVNDKPEKVEQVVKWIAGVDKDIPLHLTRYFPSNRYEEPPTDPVFMQQAFEIARSHLNWVYLGNLQSDKGQDSLCRQCGQTLVKRRGYDIEIIGLDGNRCLSCGATAPFVAK